VWLGCPGPGHGAKHRTSWHSLIARTSWRSPGSKWIRLGADSVRSLAPAHQQLAAQNEHERVLMDLVLLQSLTLGQQQRDHAIRVLVGAKDLRMVRRDTQTI
jgi:hypothetical protein